MTGGGRVAGFVRVTGGLVLANVMWLAQCLTITRVLGATAAMYAAVRGLLAGDEPMSWGEFATTARRCQSGHDRLARYASVSALSIAVLVLLAVRDAGLLSGVVLGWAGVLGMPTIAFALAQTTAREREARGEPDDDGWIFSVCRPLAAARPSLVAAATCLHLGMFLALAIAPPGVVIVIVSVAAALPACVGVVLYDRSEQLFRTAGVTRSSPRFGR